MEAGLPHPPEGFARVPPASLQLRASGDCRGGGTGREFLENLHGDSTEPWDKWYDQLCRGAGFVEASCLPGETMQPCAYAVCSANDCPERDPATWELQGKTTREGEWVTLHRVTAIPFTQRWQWRWFGFDAPEPLVSVRLRITSLRRDDSGCQLGHFHLFSCDRWSAPRKAWIGAVIAASWWRSGAPPRAAAAALAVPGDALLDLPAGLTRVPPEHLRLAAGGDCCGGGTGREVLANLHNSSTEPWDKWYHAGDVTSSFVQLTPSQSVSPCAYAVCSANDCPERDPASWVLLGKSKSSGTWITLHKIADCPFTARWQWLWFVLHCPEPISQLRLDIARVRTPSSGVQLGHLHVYVSTGGAPWASAVAGKKDHGCIHA